MGDEALNTARRIAEEPAFEAGLRKSRDELLAVRNHRVWPSWDDKVLADPVKRFLAAKKDLAKHPDRKMTALSLGADLRGLLLDKAGWPWRGRFRQPQTPYNPLESYRPKTGPPGW